MSKNFVRTTPALLLIALLASACKEDAAVKTYTVPKAPATAPHAHQPAASVVPAAPNAGPVAIPGSSAAMTATPELAAQTAGFSTPEWTAPAAWQALPATAMRKGGWRTGTATEPAEISVIVLPGDVGGLMANVRRWCGQIGMPGPTTAEELARLTKPAKVGAHEATDVPLVHDGKAITTVLVSHKGATWFFKISGTAAAVKAAQPDFDAFLATVKLP